MTFRVVMTARAEAQLKAATDWIAERAPRAALNWYNAAIRKLNTLARNPTRCELARETSKFPYELRQIVLGRRRNHRALFTIREPIVVIVSIRHSAQDEITPDDL